MGSSETASTDWQVHTPVLQVCLPLHDIRTPDIHAVVAEARHPRAGPVDLEEHPDIVPGDLAEGNHLDWMRWVSHDVVFVYGMID